MTTAMSSVSRRRWGRSGLMIPVIPFGTQGFGNLFGPVAEAEATNLVARAIGLGVNHFDCARCYGDSLRKLGPALRGVDRSTVIVSARVCLHQDRGDALHPDRPRQPAGWLPDPSADAVAARGQWSNRDDIDRARRIRQWCLDRNVSLLALALQFCLREGRIHGNPLGSQNLAELEANVRAVTETLPERVFAEFAEAGM
jgi:aryl-alcohol dehydrogenase-like predicted oxidoreductase